MEGMKTMERMKTVLTLAASLLLSGGCQVENSKRYDCSFDVGDIADCLKRNVIGVYDGVCTKDGAKRLVEVAENECMPDGVSSQFFPKSKECQESIKAAVNLLCEVVHEDDEGLL